MTFPARQKFVHASRPCFASLCDVLIAVIWIFAGIGTAHAEVPERLRLMTAAKKFDGTELVTAAFRIDAPQWLHADRVEWSIGVLSRFGDVRPITTLGPVWRIERPRRLWFLELSFSPAFVTNPRLGERTLGGHIHFASELAVGREFGDGWSLSFRAQHISNGGLNSRNPGLDLIGLSIAKHSTD